MGKTIGPASARVNRVRRLHVEAGGSSSALAVAEAQAPKPPATQPRSAPRLHHVFESDSLLFIVADTFQRALC